MYEWEGNPSRLKCSWLLLFPHNWLSNHSLRFMNCGYPVHLFNDIKIGQLGIRTHVQENEQEQCSLSYDLLVFFSIFGVLSVLKIYNYCCPVFLKFMRACKFFIILDSSLCSIPFLDVQRYLRLILFMSHKLLTINADVII